LGLQEGKKRKVGQCTKEDEKRKKRKTHAETVEEKVTNSLGVLLKDLQVLEDLLVDLDLVVEPNRVLTEEIESDLVRRSEGDVLVTKRATSDRVGFVVALFVTVTESETVDEVDRSRALTGRHLLRLEVGGVVGANAVDVLL
jgi:hypothetical protein